jgi:hypothetical protein
MALEPEPRELAEHRVLRYRRTLIDGSVKVEAIVGDKFDVAEHGVILRVSPDSFVVRIFAFIPWSSVDSVEYDSRDKLMDRRLRPEKYAATDRIAGRGKLPERYRGDERS